MIQFAHIRLKLAVKLEDVPKLTKLPVTANCYSRDIKIKLATYVIVAMTPQI